MSVCTPAYVCLTLELNMTSKDFIKAMMADTRNTAGARVTLLCALPSLASSNGRLGWWGWGVGMLGVKGVWAGEMGGGGGAVGGGRGGGARVLYV